MKTPAEIKTMDAEFAFIDWREPAAVPEAADEYRVELRSTDADPQIRVAPGHAAS